jgi:NAD(P)-dependent dehydrogenase (short-subunit alcohol dehydrogenase family)
MGPYAASKAGVEGLTDALRMETAPSGARVGCAYFGFIDTDIVRGSFAHPSTKAMQQLMPAFLRKAVPVEKAVDAIERGIERRAARVWAPRYVGGALALRGIMQPLTERRAMASRHLREGLALAQPETGDLHAQDDRLGVSVSRQKVGG